MKKNNQTAVPVIVKDRSYLVAIGICVFGFLIRLLSYTNVFNGTYVSFLETDAYDIMHLARQISTMPFGQGFHYAVNYGLFFPWLIAQGGRVFPIELVGAWLPPIIAAITLYLCYLLGKELFNKTVGLITAAFLAIMPSEFLHRSLLGYADHHALEVMLMVLTLYFIVKAIKANQKVWSWSIAAGLSLFFYLANWTAGVLLIVIVGILALIYLSYSLKRKEGWRKPVLIFGILFAVAFVLYLPLGGWARLEGFIPFVNKSHLAVVGLTSQEILSTEFTPVSKVTTSEMMPLLFPFGSFDLGVVITNLNIFIVLFICGLPLLWRYRRDDRVMMFSAWALVITAITLWQRRFLYYFEIPVAVLSALVIYTIADSINVKLVITTALITIPLVLVNIPTANTVVHVTAFSMNKEWYTDLQWLKTQPITNSITAWSDYGSWILYETNHQPNLMPGGGGTEVAQLFLSQNDAEAVKTMTELKTQYLIVDQPTYERKFSALEVTANETIPQSEIKNTLIYRLLYLIQMPTDLHLTLIHSSATIRIFEFKGVN